MPRQDRPGRAAVAIPAIPCGYEEGHGGSGPAVRGPVAARTELGFEPSPLCVLPPNLAVHPVSPSAPGPSFPSSTVMWGVPQKVHTLRLIMHSSGLDLKRKKHQLRYLLLSVYTFWGDTPYFPAVGFRMMLGALGPGLGLRGGVRVGGVRSGER